MRGSSQQQYFVTPWLNDIHKIFFSRTLYQSDNLPKELLNFYNFIQKRDNWEHDQYLRLKNMHPLQILYLERYSMHDLYLENKLTPKYHKLVVRTDFLERINLSRICEYRSKSLFRLHSIESKPKECKRFPNRWYGERIKFLFWFNQQVVLSCHLKRIVDNGTPPMTL